MNHHCDDDNTGSTLKSLAFWAIFGFLIYWCFKKAPKTTVITLTIVGIVWFVTAQTFPSTFK